MAEHTEVRGSTPRWGPLFGARAADWAQTWEGPDGWGTSVYGHVLDHARIGAGTRVLDCGCGAGRFARMAADRGADVAGIDAAPALVEIAASRTPSGEFRVGDGRLVRCDARGTQEAGRQSRHRVAVLCCCTFL